MKATDVQLKLLLPEVADDPQTDIEDPPAPCAARTTPANPIVPSQRCCGISQYLCDFRLPSGGTCDMPLCADHATQVGPDRHLCPRHAADGREAA